MHLGNARSFLLAWLSVRSRRGSLVLRIEDLDHPKVKPWATRQAMDDLRWLGLDWDEGPDLGGDAGPYVQSLRRERYRDALEHLREAGLAYPCTCSRRDVENAQSAPHPEEESLFYPGTCRGRFRSYAEARRALPRGRLPCWRFLTPCVESCWADRIRGEQREVAAETVGDFPLAREEHGAGYMLAVVVDDAAMGITEVVRGDDLLGATHRQLLLQHALGFSPPRYAHVPLVVAEDGRRLAKRHGDTRIASLREAGLPADRIVGLLAWWCGWADFGARVNAGELIGRASLDTLRREPAVLTGEVRRFLELQDGREADRGGRLARAGSSPHCS